jgi:hypothetical protein
MIDYIAPLLTVVLIYGIPYLLLHTLMVTLWDAAKKSSTAAQKKDDFVDPPE